MKNINNDLIEKEFPENLQKNIIKDFFNFDQSYINVYRKLKELAKEPITFENNVITINNWTKVMSAFNGGDCVDISIKLLKLWIDNKTIKDLRSIGFKIYFAQGNEPQFFYEEKENHAFILLIKDNISIILDPSLQVIEYTYLSNYKIRQTDKIKNIVKINRGSERKLDISKNEMAIIGITNSRNYSVHLGFNLKDFKIIPFINLTDRNHYYLIENNSDLSKLQKFINTSKEIKLIINALEDFIIITNP